MAYVTFFPSKIVQLARKRPLQLLRLLAMATGEVSPQSVYRPRCQIKSNQQLKFYQIKYYSNHLPVFNPDLVNLT